MVRVAVLAFVCILVGGSFALAQGQPPAAVQQSAPLWPSVVVTGRGEASAGPDRAVVRLGAVAQAEKASAAQQQVNERVGQILEKIKAAGVTEEKIQTVGLTLGPVYEQQHEPGRVQPRIIAYQVTNTVQVHLDDLAQIGSAIDAALAAGANHLEGVWFELKDDADQRREAIQKAVAEARAKAEAIEQATQTRLSGIIEIIEGDVSVVRPMMMQRMAEFAAGDATPVQAGQVRVEATVSIRYRLQGSGGVAPLTR